jgi:hypothetical protein
MSIPSSTTTKPNARIVREGRDTILMSLLVVNFFLSKPIHVIIIRNIRNDHVIDPPPHRHVLHFSVSPVFGVRT